jgi:glycerol-3-phosphate dehydrogenase
MFRSLPPFSPPSYPEEGEVVDLVVVGGGITGAGIAWDAGHRGLTTVLFESRDYGSGTSGRSSKLIHGGLRYIEQGNFHLVFEAVRERTRLRKLARHLVRPLPFFLPHYRYQKYPRAVLGIGLWIYEALTAFRVEKLHRSLSAQEFRKIFPYLNPKDLDGGYLYYDASTQDARLVWELIRGAKEAGVRAYSYTKVTGFSRKGDLWEVLYQTNEKKEKTLLARALILSLGAFAYRELPHFFPKLKHTVRPSKGIHLVLDPRRSFHLPGALVMTHPRDRRVTFLLPGRGYLYLGTTDTEEEADLEEPQVYPQDVEYLLEVYNKYFPDVPLDESGITATWAGLRPLLDEGNKGASYRATREHRIFSPEPGVFIIEGGKLTTFRVMAEECIDHCSRYLQKRFGVEILPSRTAKEPLPGSRGIETEEDLVTLGKKLREFGLGDDGVSHLLYTYGVQVLEILPYIERDPEPLLPHLPYTLGEIRYILEREDVGELEDLLLRRTEIYFQDPENGVGVLEKLKEVISEVFKIPPESLEPTIQRYKQRVERGLGFRAVSHRAFR